MKKQILHRVFWLSNALAGMAVLLICVLYGWEAPATANAFLYSFALCTPTVLCLQVVFWMEKCFRLQLSLVWMMLLASIPLLALLPSGLVSTPLPGDPLFLAVLGAVCSYAGILYQALPIAHLFQKRNNETV